MKTLVQADAPTATATIAALDAAAVPPYPRTPTDTDVRSKSGRHVPHAQARTLHAAAAVTTPDGLTLAVLVDATAEAVLPAQQRAALVTLDPAVWLPGPTQVIAIPDTPIADGPLPG